MKSIAKLLLRCGVLFLIGVMGAGMFLVLVMLAMSNGALPEGLLVGFFFLCFALGIYVVLCSLWEALTICYHRCVAKHSTCYSSHFRRSNPSALKLSRLYRTITTTPAPRPPCVAEGGNYAVGRQCPGFSELPASDQRPTSRT